MQEMKKIKETQMTTKEKDLSGQKAMKTKQIE